MGFFHFQIKKSTQNHTPAAKHYGYIMREGQHNDRTNIHEFIVGESFNIPSWAKTPKEFFEAADQYERKNGIVYREIEIGLPNQLSLEDNIKLVHNVIENCIGTDKVVSYAIHKKYSKINKSLGQESLNIHAHVMFSERSITDLKEKIKPPELFFKRYNQANYEKSGYKKDRRFTNNSKAAALYIIKCREYWANIVNAKFKELGINDSITPLSIEDQKLAPADSKDETKLNEIKGRERSRLTFWEYKKLEKILLQNSSIEEKLSQITSLDIQDLIEHRKKTKRKKLKFSNRFKQKLLCLKNLQNNYQTVKESIQTKYLTEILSALGQRFIDASMHIKRKIQRIQESKYYDSQHLRIMAINITTNGLFIKHAKLLDIIKKLQAENKNTSTLKQTVTQYQKEITAFITPENTKKTEATYLRYRSKKQEFTQKVKAYKEVVKLINGAINKITQLANELKKINSIEEINNLLTQDQLKDIDKALTENLQKGTNGFKTELMLPVLEKTIELIKDTQAALEEKQKSLNKSNSKEDYEL